MPGRLFQVPRQHHPHPWHSLFALTQQLSHVPILPLHWRVQLVHSMHPYTPYVTINSNDINIQSNTLYKFGPKEFLIFSLSILLMPDNRKIVLDHILCIIYICCIFICYYTCNTICGFTKGTN